MFEAIDTHAITIRQRGQFPNWQRGQSPCGHFFLTRRGRRVYVVVRSFYRRCFNRLQMSELEIDLEPFSVHFALTGRGDSPQWALGTVPMWAFQRRAAGTVPNGQRGLSPCGNFNAGQWGLQIGSGDSPHVSIFNAGQWGLQIGSGACPRMGNFNAGQRAGSGDCSRIRQRGQSPCEHFPSPSREDLSMGGDPSCLEKARRSRICLSDNNQTAGTVPMWAFQRRAAGTVPESGNGDSPRVSIFRSHPERIFQWTGTRRF